MLTVKLKPARLMGKNYQHWMLTIPASLVPSHNTRRKFFHSKEEADAATLHILQGGLVEWKRPSLENGDVTLLIIPQSELGAFHDVIRLLPKSKQKLFSSKTNFGYPN
jgi:hypothetical protein